MIELTTAKDGARIFTWQGKLVCSGVRPVREAEKWADGKSERFRDCKVVIVLGLANGFHAVEIAKRFPGLRVCVVNDNNEFLVPSAQVLDIQSSYFEVITLKSADDLKSNSKIRKILNLPYSVVEFPPATALNRDFYNKVGELLVGRTQEALEFCLSCRGDSWSQFKYDNVKESRNSQGLQLISFKDLQMRLSESDSSFRVKAIGQVLKELIR